MLQLTLPDIFPLEQLLNTTTLLKTYSKFHKGHLDTKVARNGDGPFLGSTTGNVGPASGLGPNIRSQTILSAQSTMQLNLSLKSTRMGTQQKFQKLTIKSRNYSRHKGKFTKKNDVSLSKMNHFSTILDEFHPK